MNASVKIIFQLTLFLNNVCDWSVCPWVFGPLVCVYSVKSVFCRFVLEYWSIGLCFVTEFVFCQ